MELTVHRNSQKMHRGSKDFMQLFDDKFLCGLGGTQSHSVVKQPTELVTKSLLNAHFCPEKSPGILS